MHYIPINRHSLVTNKRFDTKIDLSKIKIDEALSQYYVSQPKSKYINILYPKEAIDILCLSRSDKWPINGPPDPILEKVLTLWLRDRIDPNQYSIQLFEAIKKLDCLDGVYLRLNFDIITQPTATYIKVDGVTKNKSKTQFSGETRIRIKQFLKQDGKYLSHIDDVYNGLRRIHEQYDLEQSLLAWMAYLVIKAVAENAQPHLRNNQLLLETSLK